MSKRGLIGILVFFAIPLYAGDVNQHFVALGDCGLKTEAQSKIIQAVLNSSPDFLVLTGDLAYPNGSYQDFQENFFAPFAPILSRIPVYPAMGNHEHITEDGKPYLDLFNIPRYYSFDKGPVHFTVLDSEPIQRDKNIDFSQLDWVSRDLESTTKIWKIVVFHHPPYSDDLHHGNNVRIQERLVPILEKNRVDLVLNGHAHGYQRSDPIHGIYYVITGGGGADLHPISTTLKNMRIAVAAYNFVDISVSNREIHLKALTPNGKTLDDFSIQ